METGSGAAAAALGSLGATGSHDNRDRGLRACSHPEEDDIVPELVRSIHPRERPDWEETLSAMARGAEIRELLGDPPLRSCGSTASMKVKNIKKLTFTKGHFPKLAECAHFHYENVDLGTIQLTLADEQSEVTWNGCDSRELVYLVQISCQGRSWIVKRSYEDFRVLDKHLHLCIYDRRFSQLPELPRFDCLRDRAEAVSQMLKAYLSRLSVIADNKINCGPALTWMEIDNKGNHLLVHEESCINVPAIAAAHVIKRYSAQAADELSFEVGDIVSVIDMPPKEDTTWWRGKHGFQVGFFPSECVELINDKVPQSVTSSVPKPVSKKHGKLITFLRTFMKSRPTKQKLKQRGILRERVFGCDLGEHLLNSAHDIPQVLHSCTEFIEKHGVVDGIYRLSGIASNIQKLRHEFDSEQIPDLTKDLYLQDIHCVGSLCKLYFRELPNPLLTYQLYEKFSDAVSAATDEERLVKIHDVIQQLPPPHYRTLEFLMRHLSHLAAYSYITNMHSKNLAIVWAPNLLRSKQIESACFSGTAAFMEVRIQSVVVEFILNHVDVLFSTKLSSLIREGAGHCTLARPKSLLVSSPSTKLLTLEEAQARTQAQINSPVTADSKYIEVGEGPSALQGKFHTVIDFPTERKKVKKSPVGNWRSFFNLGKSSSSSVAKRKLQRNRSEPHEMKTLALTGSRADTGTLRSAKSEESLTSLHNVEGESKLYRPRRPRSSSDALSASFNGDLLDRRNHCDSYDNVPQEDSEGDEGPIRVPALISPPRCAEDMDLSPPDMGVASLDFDPMSFQCSSPRPEPDPPSPRIRDPGGGGSDSETASPPCPDKFTSPFLSPDFSPVLEEKAVAKHTSFAVKMVHALSPKISRKSTKPPPMTISEPVAISLPSRVSEMMMGGTSSPSPPSQRKPHSSGGSRSPPPPPQVISVLPRSEGSQLEGYSATESRGQGATERTDSFSQPQQGAVPLDSPQGPAAPVSSVSLLPPPPPPKNAARMLALALAESAQQTCIQSQRKPPEPQVPVSSPPRAREAPETPPARPQPPPADYGDRVAPVTPVSAPATAFTSASVTTARQPTSVSYCFTMNNATVATAASTVTATTSSSTSSSTAASPITPSQHTAIASPPAHRSPERQQPAMGQVPVSTALNETPTAVQQVWASGGVPSQRPLKPADQPAPLPHQHASSSARSSSGMAAEKPRETSKPPALQPRAESVPLYHSYGPPPPPVRSIESKLAAATLSGTVEAANASNFHAILAGASVPASVEEALPPPPPPKSAALQQAYLYHSKSERVQEPSVETYYHHRAGSLGQPSVPFHYQPESVPPHLSYPSKPEPQPVYSARSDTRYSTLGPRAMHSKPRGVLRAEYCPAGPTVLRSQGCSPVDASAVYPTIRRVRSLHATPTVRSVPVSRTEVPPDDELYYCQRPVYQYKPYQQPLQSEYHVTQLQPYFENGRVQYRYSPSSGASPLDAPYYDVDPYGTIRLRHVHSFTSRDLTPQLSKATGKSGGYHCLSRALVPPGKEHSFVSRDMPPSQDVKALYLAWDPEETDKYRMQSIRRESRTRQKNKAPVMSQYDNVGPLLPGERGGVEILHLRSKSDPGKAVLMAAEGKDGRCGAAAQPPRHLISESDVLSYMEPDRHCQGNGLNDKPALPQKQVGSRNPQPMQPHNQPQPRAVPPQQQESSQDHRNEPGEYEHSSRHWLEHQSSYERQDPERLSIRIRTTSSYPEEDPQLVSGKSSAPPKPERSHSIRGTLPHYQHHPTNPPRHPQENLERDYTLPHYQHHPDNPAPHPQENLERDYTLPYYQHHPANPALHPQENLERDYTLPHYQHHPANPAPHPQENLERDYTTPHYQHHPTNPAPHPQENLERAHSSQYSYQPHGTRHSAMTVLSQYDNLDDYHPIPQPQTQPQASQPSRGGVGTLTRGGISGGGSFIAPGFPHALNNKAYSTALGQGSFLQAEMSLQRPEAKIHAE
ncbi:rho GTPase-activating protein 32 isoform X2 [Polyodon spathula]|uniref:rho GTPase-activating protein 32 isoform X2 n=1 Tax=Polyodon spathula TaxID=7913 RepID=UPI001B7DBDA0|nr:rho GTPase-activating protein 32 isoform X2 [Polyodon spathula]